MSGTEEYPAELPGSDGEHELQERYGTCKRARGFYSRQMPAASMGAMARSKPGGLFSVLLICSCMAAGDEGTPGPLPAAHAHNDYLHKRPLLDALAHGFCSAEADIFLVDGALLVAHERASLDKNRTLKALYLDPLLERTRKNSGRVHPGGPVFTLLIDIKDHAEKTYTALHSLLGKYPGMLSEVRGGKHLPRGVKVVISGNRPKQLMKAQELRFAGVDGRLGDLESAEPAHFLPMISDRWSRVFRWRGKGAMPAAESAKLRDIVNKAHSGGRVVRFWATPEDPAVWKVLLEAGVDLVNTDDLAGLQKFLLERKGS